MNSSSRPGRAAPKHRPGGGPPVRLRGAPTEVEACPHRPPCPGCPRYGDARPPNGAVGRLQELARELGAPAPSLVSGVGPGYRHRARLMVRGRANAPLVGIFQEGTHDVVDIPRCVVHHPLVNEAAFALKNAIKAARIAPYADASHAGLVRALQVVVERSSQRCQLVVVANAESPSALGPLWDLMQQALGEKVHSLWFNGHTARSNAILGPVWRHIAGPEVIVDEVGGARVYFPPAAFGQANPALMDDIVREIHGWIPRGARVLELYAGVGAIGLGLVRRGERVVFNEIGEGSLAGLERGIAELESVPAGSVSVVPGPAEQAVGRASEADVVIVDPPRKGLGDVVCQELLAKAPARLVYLSCGVDSFLREARDLARAYSLRAVRAYGLFPYTDHVETLALFERKR